MLAFFAVPQICTSDSFRYDSSHVYMWIKTSGTLLWNLSLSLDIHDAGDTNNRLWNLTLSGYIHDAGDKQQSLELDLEWLHP